MEHDWDLIGSEQFGRLAGQQDQIKGLDNQLEEPALHVRRTVSSNPLLFILATWLVLAWRVAGY